MLYERIFNQDSRLRILSGVKSKRRIEETQKEHLKIVEACLNENWGLAAEAMKEHLICSKRASFEAIFEDKEMLL